MVNAPWLLFLSSMLFFFFKIILIVILGGVLGYGKFGVAIYDIYAIHTYIYIYIQISQ